MPRRPLVLSDKYPYHVTARANNCEWFYVHPDLCWRIFCEQLGRVSELYGIRIFAFVLMSNHFHLILETPQANLGDVMRVLLTSVSKAIQKETGRINDIFGARYKWSLLCDAYSVAYVYKYVARNPVRSGLSGAVERYLFSSFCWENQRIRAPVADGIGPLWKGVPRLWGERTQWLNLPTPKDLEILIRRGLKREAFHFSKDNSQRKGIEKLRELYQVVV